MYINLFICVYIQSTQGTVKITCSVDVSTDKISVHARELLVSEATSFP